MISYRISSPSEGLLQRENIHRILPTNPKFKEVTYNRVFESCRFFAGDRIKMRGTSKHGVVTEVITELDKVKWDKNRPHFIVVKFDEHGDKEFLAHPSQLRKRSK